MLLIRMIFPHSLLAGLVTGMQHMVLDLELL